MYTLINRLTAEGKPVYRLSADGPAGARGDIWLPRESVDAATLRALGHELHVPFEPVTALPEADPLSVRPRRIGLFKPWIPSMDEGWTRFVLERYGFPFVNLHNEDIRSGDFAEAVDLLLVPDVDPGILAKGKPSDEDRARFWAPLPPEYAGGWDEWEPTEDKATKRAKRGGNKDKPDPGGKRIREWVERGGTVVALDSSTDYFIELFALPATNVLAKTSRDTFDCPGSTLRVLVDTTHPLGFGMREDYAVYFARSPAFRTRVPDRRFERRVVARYPEDAKDILISGYLRGGELLENRAAVVEYRVGKGSVVLIGFRVQHRAQPLRTFKLLFNALYDLEPATSEN